MAQALCIEDLAKIYATIISETDKQLAYMSEQIAKELKRRVIDMSEVYDRATKAWFSSHICQQTTVCRCEKCGLFYKPSLGHKCKAKE